MTVRTVLSVGDEAALLRDDAGRCIECVVLLIGTAIERQGTDRVEALHALEAEHDVLRAIGRVDDLDDVFTRLLVDHGTGEQAIFPFGRRCGEGGGDDIRATVAGVHLLHIVAHGLHAAQVVEPDEVGAPLPAFDMCEQGSVGCHVHDVGVGSSVVMKAAS